MSAPNPLHDVHVHASPHDVPWLDDPGMTFWKPTFAEQLKLMGPKQWAMLALAPLGVALIFLCFYIHVFWILAVKLGVKAVVVVVALIGGGMKMTKKALAARSDPFCIRCGYSLLGLPDGHRCPECGLPISLPIIAEYRRDPEHFVSRWKSRHSLVVVPVAALDVPPNARRRKSRDGT